MPFNGPPAVDFYSMLSGLGDTIAKNRDAATRQAAITSAFTPGPDGKIDYQRALTTPGLDLPTMALIANQQSHADIVAHQSKEDKRNADNDTFNHNYQNTTLGLAQSREKREATDYENTPDQYATNPKFGQPGEPQYVDQYAAAKNAAGGVEQPNSVKEYNYYAKTFVPTPQSPAPMDYATFSTAKARAAATNVTNNVDTRAENEQSKAIGGALGKAQAADIEAGGHASQTLRQLATLDNANKAGGDDVSSGPFGELVLKGKQGLNEIAGEDLANAAPAEVIKKVGFGLATNLTKAITNRPAQMEFMKALENVPNLMMSKTGRTAMTSIMMQEKRAEQQIGAIAARHRDVPNGPVWQEVKDKYYEEHPLISPFTGKPFSPDDISMVVGSVPGGAASSTVAPGGLTRADVEAELKRRQAQQ